MDNKTSPRFEADRFTEHEVTVYKTTEFAGVPVERLVWQKPGTRSGLIRFLRIGHELFVSGDYFSANYGWYEPQTLEWIADTDFQYFHGKCIASRLGTPPQEWDTEYFIEYGVDLIKSFIPTRWDESEDKITDDHPLVQAWRYITRFHSPYDDETTCALFEKRLTADFVRNVPIKYFNNDVASVESTAIATLFFGNDWEAAPNGWVPAIDCVMHHGALRMAVDWCKQNMTTTWYTAQEQLKER